MKVPTKVLKAVMQLVQATEHPTQFAPPTPDEMQAVKEWAQPAIERRSSPRAPAEE